jgi:hypothetical protein
MMARREPTVWQSRHSTSVIERMRAETDEEGKKGGERRKRQGDKEKRRSKFTFYM